jgi:hypothetical protein
MLDFTYKSGIGGTKFGYRRDGRISRQWARGPAEQCSHLLKGLYSIASSELRHNIKGKRFAHQTFLVKVAPTQTVVSLDESWIRADELFGILTDNVVGDERGQHVQCRFRDLRLQESCMRVRRSNDTAPLRHELNGQ